MNNPLLQEIVDLLVHNHGCHTVILYGSRARGEETLASDYDVLGVKAGIFDTVRDARPWNGTYLDLFIYSEEKLKQPDASLLSMWGGKVLVEKDNWGHNFLKKLDDVFQKGPKKLPPDEINALQVWAEKSLLRSEAGGIEGNFRRIEMIPALLEHYFTTRGLWYRGPKESLRSLKTTNPEVYAAFDEAMKIEAPLSTMKLLVKLIKIR